MLRDARGAAPRVRLTGIDLLPIRATSRTVWLVVRLRTDAGLTGLGEASDAFGFANTTAANAATMRMRLQTFFELVRGGSPLDVERYRQRGMPMVKGDLVSATAFPAIRIPGDQGPRRSMDSRRRIHRRASSTPPSTPESRP
jgi:L-alanine-DL-glutamate epimerase-like enolase superfamily enzyme